MFNWFKNKKKKYPSKDDLEIVYAYISEELKGRCRDFPIASDKLIKKYGIDYRSYAALIIGYMEELKAK